mgnify:FL=1
MFTFHSLLDSSFSANAKVHLKEGYIEIEWSCLDWNVPSIEFIKKLVSFKKKEEFILAIN